VSTEISSIERTIGCLLGGAVGDALGAPIEFMSASKIFGYFGPSGISGYVPSSAGRLGWITDDTQMTLFTAEGLIRAEVKANMNGGRPDYVGVTTDAYLRWLATQRINAFHSVQKNGWLYKTKGLHEVCAPGRTCIHALQRVAPSVSMQAVNDSKGCGGVMRVAPVGLFGYRAFLGAGAEKAVFELGCDLARITHGHPTGYLSAGAFSLLISLLMLGNGFEVSIGRVLSVLVVYQGHEETSRAIEQAIALVSTAPGDSVAMTTLGEGWVAEEALAVAIYCGLSFPNDFSKALLLSVNHGGDSDSTGSIVGNLLGALLGVKCIPSEWIEQLELTEVVRQVGADLNDIFEWDLTATEVRSRYPG
jgi:ADP-ribosylglycohydrolase